MWVFFVPLFPPLKAVRLAQIGCIRKFTWKMPHFEQRFGGTYAAATRPSSLPYI